MLVNYKKPEDLIGENGPLKRPSWTSRLTQFFLFPNPKSEAKSLP